MRAIPIAPAAASGCGEESGRIPRLELPLARREFLKGSGILMGSLAAGSVLAALAPSTAWALELGSLSTAEGEALMKMGRVLFPHAQLPDAVYALLAKDLDGKAAADPAAAKQIRAGVAALDEAAGGSFAAAPSAKQREIVKAMQGQPFFATVRGQCVTSLYNNDMAFAVFGYEGASWEKGGYITRGFQDLTWLPAPPLEASPKSFAG